MKSLITVKTAVLFLLCVAVVKAVSELHRSDVGARDETAPRSRQ
jgi:hypothetical protein